MAVKSAKPKVAPKHPPYLELVKEAVAATAKPRQGVSRIAISKYLATKYGKDLGSNSQSQVRLALQKAVKAGVLLPSKGSFRLSPAAKKPPKVKKPKVKKAKKPKAKKAKKPKAKKAKKPKAKKAKKPKVKKASKPKSKKPAAAGKKVVAKAKKASKPKKAATTAATPVPAQ
jgi:histone H1/5